MIPICILSNFEQFCGTQNLSTGYGGESAGLDLYNAGPDLQIYPAKHRFQVKGTETFYGNYSEIPSEDSKQVFGKLIPTGIKVAIPQGYVGLIQERGSVTKTPLKVRAGVIDSGYNGEIFINCVNVSAHPFTLLTGAKTPFQLVIVPISNWFTTVSEAEYTQITTNNKRGSGKIGSTDHPLVGQINAKQITYADMISSMNMCNL